MALSDADWRQIYDAIGGAIPPSIVVQGVVVKRDALHNLIWLKEFGDQPIPLFMFDFSVHYFDTKADGSVQKRVTRTIDVKIQCPKVGDTVLVLKQHGSRSLPKCIGVLRSSNFLALDTGD